MERGLLQPPSDENTLKRIAKILGLKLNSSAYVELKDLASLSRGKIPSDILKDKRLLASLPVIFRNLRGEEKPTETELINLLNKIKENNESELD